MATINPYIGFDGNCEEAFNFYKSVFGTEFTYVMKFKDVPSGYNMPASQAEKIMHIALPIGKGTSLMGTDAASEKINVGNNIYINITVESETEAHKLFDGLSKGGQVTSPLKVEFWGDLFGTITDKYGIHWMVLYELSKQTQTV
jgi:PhnB protein